MFIILLLTSEDSIYPQTDTMYIDVGTSVVAYPLTNIAQLTFVGIPVDIDGQDLVKMNQILESFVLHQNYPNPFNPVTNISYHLPKRGPVRVCVYDLEGQVVAEIMNAEQEAGDHKLSWDGSSGTGTPVSSGVYLYQVQFDNSVLTKKMILIK